MNYGTAQTLQNTVSRCRPLCSVAIRLRIKRHCHVESSAVDDSNSAIQHCLLECGCDTQLLLLLLLLNEVKKFLSAFENSEKYDTFELVHNFLEGLFCKNNRANTQIVLLMHCSS